MPPNQPAIYTPEPATMSPSRSFKAAWLFWLLALPVLWWALRAFPFQQIAATIVTLRGWQIVALAGINLGVIAVFSLRWWIILRALGGQLPFLRAIAYHLAGFGVSYFTAGPQVGGEPLQVMLVSQKHSVKLPAAISSVFLDKVFELLTNFTFLVFGSLWVLSSGAFGNVPGTGLWAAAAALLVLPLLHMVALRRGVFPFSQLLERLPKWNWLQKAQTLTAQSEELISRLLQAHPKVIFSTAIISAGGWLLMFVEYALMLRFLGGVFNLTQMLTAFLASQLAFLTPLPAGLGALEASQVMVFTSFGASAGIGLSLSLLMRARDVLFGLAGIVIGGNALHKRSAQPRVVPVQEE